MNRISQHLLGLLGIMGLGVVTTGHADAQSRDDLLRQAELACDRALQENTIEALEEYLRLFPNAPTSCKVLALNALSSFSPSDGDGPQPTANSSYGG